VVAFRREQGRVVGALLSDGETGRGGDGARGGEDTDGLDLDLVESPRHSLAPSPCLPVSARLTINAAGPWVDVVRRLLGETRPPLLGGTKGRHLVLPPPPAGPRGPVYAPARSDGRPFFILPWREMLL